MRKIPCEIYSRIVGYFRPLEQWNPAQKEQFHDRIVFEIQENQKKESA